MLGFPCNQFLGQEPGTEEEVQACVRGELKATFPVFAKTDVNGSDVDEVFRFVKTALPGFLGTTSVKWNFTKFLIDRRGNAVGRYGPKTPPLDIAADITQALSGSAVTPDTDRSLIALATAIIRGGYNEAGSFRGLEIRDRTHHLTTYKACLVGRELVDWLVATGHARDNDRQAAIALGNELLGAQLLRHVCAEHALKDEALFYYVSETPMPPAPGQQLNNGGGVAATAESGEGEGAAGAADAQGATKPSPLLSGCGAGAEGEGEGGSEGASCAWTPPGQQ